MSQTIPSTDGPLKLINANQLPFKPFYRPKEMLQLGVFGGGYFYNNPMVIQKQNVALFTSVSASKYSVSPLAANNYFNILIPLPFRNLGIPASLKRQHKLGWFQWYCEWYYGKTANYSTAGWRMQEWITEVNSAWFYIKSGNYTGGGNKITDLAFLPERRQRLLEFGVDPTIPPENYECLVNF